MGHASSKDSRESFQFETSSSMAEPGYGIGKVSEMTSISAFTIRYYDKCGFLPNLKRDRRGVRTFSHADVRQLYLVEALRKSGLSIEGIQYFVRLQKRGAATEGERLSILRSRKNALEYQRAELESSLVHLNAAAVDLEDSES